MTEGHRVAGEDEEKWKYITRAPRLALSKHVGAAVTMCSGEHIYLGALRLGPLAAL